MKLAGIEDLLKKFEEKGFAALREDVSPNVLARGNQRHQEIGEFLQGLDQPHILDDTICSLGLVCVKMMGDYPSLVFLPRAALRLTIGGFWVGYWYASNHNEN